MKHLHPILLLVVIGCSPASPDGDPSPKAESARDPLDVAPAPAGSITLVDDPSLVCMVNNQFMGVPQIPVVVEGTTYFGCCEMCKTKLANEPASRTAIDPISGNPVDKAAAVMGKTATGSIVYFENHSNLTSYSTSPSR